MDFVFISIIRSLICDKNGKLNQTDQIAEFIKNNDEAEGLSPEGTTHYCDYIKSGFYYIAKKVACQSYAVVITIERVNIILVIQ